MAVGLHRACDAGERGLPGKRIAPVRQHGTDQAGEHAAAPRDPLLDQRTPGQSDRCPFGDHKAGLSRDRDDSAGFFCKSPDLLPGGLCPRILHTPWQKFPAAEGCDL